MPSTLTGLQTIRPNAIVAPPGPNLLGNPAQLAETAADAFDPRSSGLQRPVGSMLFTRTGAVAYQKVGPLATDWALVASSTAAPQTIVLADSGTNTAPDLQILRHTTDGTAAAGLGTTAAVEIESAAGTTRRAMTDVTTLTSAVNAAEESQRIVSLLAAGALVKVGGFGLMNLGTYAMFYVGDPGNFTGIRNQIGTNLLDLLAAGSAYLRCQSAINSVLQKMIMSGVRLEEAAGANVASATTVTLGNDGNVFTLTGVTTVNGIVTTGWQAGSRIALILPNGITITHNSGAPGASAVAIKLRAAANLVTAKVYVLELIFDGTFWYQPD